MNKKLLRQCPICSNVYGIILNTQNFIFQKDNPLPPSYDVVSCNNCGFCFADTSAKQKDDDYFYIKLSKYEDEKTSSGSSLSVYDKKRLSLTASTISSFLYQKNLAIADVGTGNVGLLLELKALGYTNLTAIDPSAICCEGIQKNGIQAIHSSLFNIDQNLKFDCIILSHVLEYIDDIQECIHSLTNLLNDWVILYLETPNASEYQNYYVKPFHYFDIEHINHFDAYLFKNLQFRNKNISLIFIEKKEILVSESYDYPAIYAIFKKQDVQNMYNIESSTECTHHINSYINVFEENNTNQKLKNINNTQLVIVWLAGSYTIRLLTNTRLSEFNILYFVDNDYKKQGKMLYNRLILSAEEFKSTFSLPPPNNATIIIASALFAEEIKNQIKEMNLLYPTIII